MSSTLLERLLYIVAGITALHLLAPTVQQRTEAVMPKLLGSRRRARVRLQRALIRLGRSLATIWEHQRPSGLAGELSTAATATVFLLPAFAVNMVILFIGLELVLPEGQAIQTAFDATTAFHGKGIVSLLSSHVDDLAVLFVQLHKHASAISAVGLSFIEGLLGLLLFRSMKPDAMTSLSAAQLWRERRLWFLVFGAIVLAETILASFRTYFYAIDYTSSWAVLGPICVLGGALGFVAPWGIAATLHVVVSTLLVALMLAIGSLAVLLCWLPTLACHGASVVGSLAASTLVAATGFGASLVPPLVRGLGQALSEGASRLFRRRK